ncbi:WD40 repeat domain-containing protein [Roseateles sp. SL47]|uniref:WD40 repeat domain-containing protein n=1 Tax=Roseateles sp. SL47 TaxID=2995138 RepID=UPI002272011C|nr:WD40 repeat domain-containing protein [Roseateles sp. SL47]WAC73514.1 WD40 repeat domain-containing protein [Roseateles sp. SL47]
MIEHQSPISGIATYGGRLVATAGYDNHVILWDHALRLAIARGTHDHLANHVAFSRDGRHLVTSSSDHTARLWSVPEMKLLAVISSHHDDVEMSAFHPFDRYIATASRDHDVLIHDFSGRLVQRLAGHTADVISVCWSSDGRELVSSSDDGTVKRWSFHDGRLLDDYDLGGAETDAVVVSADGTIFAGNDDGEIVVLREGGAARWRLHAAGIKRLVLDEGGRLLVSLSYDRALRVSDAGASSLVPHAESMMPEVVWPRSCAFLNPGTLVFGTFGSAYALHDIRRGTWDTDSVRATRGVNAVAVHDGRRLTIGDSGVLRIDGKEATHIGSLCNFLTPVAGRVFTGGQMGAVFDALSGEQLHQHRSPINCGAAFNLDGASHVVLGTYTGEGLVFKVSESGAVLLVATLPLHKNAVKGIAVSGGRIFAVCADCSAAWFSTEDFSELARVSAAHGRIANGCARLPEGRFASVGRDHKLRLWTGTQAVVVDTPHTHSIKCVSCSGDGRFVATGSYYGVVAIYDTFNASWTGVRRVSAAGISSLCFDALTQCFLAASYDGDVHELVTTVGG